MSGLITTGKLRRNLWLAFALINAVALALAAYELRGSLLQHYDRARISAVNLNRVLEANLVGSFEKINMALLAVADEIGRETRAGGIVRQDLEDFIDKLHAMLPELDSIRVAGADGIIKYGIGVDPEARITSADRDYFIRLREDSGAGMVFSDPVLGRISGKLIMVFARRLNGPDGAFAGVVYAVVTIDHFTRKFSGLNLELRGSVALLNDRFVLVARYPSPPGENVIGQIKPTQQFLEQVGRGRLEGYYIAASPVDGEDKVFSFRKLAGYPFFVVVTQPLATALASWKTEALSVVAMVAALFLVTVVSARLIYQGWTRQAQASQALALAKDELEDRVAERTAELSVTIGQLEEARVQAESAGRMKADFLANVSHELKTPLNPIVAFTDMVLDSELTTDQRESLVEVRRAASRLLSMIESVIELTGMDTRRTEYSQVSPRTVLDLVVRELAPAAAEKGLSLVKEVDPSAPELIETDLSLVRLALVKIGENAVKFTREGGIVLNVYAGEGVDGIGWVRFAVRDTGIGMPADRIGRITAGLSQADSALTKRHPGLGLGLAAVHKALERLGGRLEVDSEEGRGSTFAVWLPIARA